MSDETTKDTDTTPPASAPTGDMIPRARLAEVIAQRDEARTALDTLRGEHGTLKARVDELTPFAERATALEAELGAVRALSQVGIVDEDGQAVATMLFDRLKDKPEGGLSGWLSSMRDDPSKAPKPLAPYLAKPAAPATPSAPKGTTAKPTPTDPNATAVPATAGKLSAEALKDAQKRLARGDKSALTALRRHFHGS